VSKSAASADGAGDGFSFKCLLAPLVPLLSASANATVPLFRYRLGMTNDVATRLPVTLKASWKCEPALTSLIIQFRAAVPPPLPPADPSTPAPPAQPMVLKAVTLEVAVGGGVTGVQSRPDAAWDATAQTARWALGDVSLVPGGAEVSTRVLARFVVTQGPSVPAPLSVSFAVEGQVLSRTAVRLASDADARIIDLQPAAYQLVTGKYFAIPTPPSPST
jgi:hypothetical protein